MLSFVEKYLLAPGSILGLEGLFVKGFDLFDKKGKGPAQVSICLLYTSSKELTGARTSGGVCGLIRRNAKNLTKA